MDRLATMEAFVKVAETKSFSEAARRLRSSKSLVSRQISALEAELGVRLLQRTTRSLTLTEEGRTYHAEVTRILADIELANAAVTQSKVAPRGRLRVSAPMSFGILHLAPILPRFLARFPEVELDLSLNDRYVDLIDEGFDLSIRVGRLAESSLVARRLAPFRMILCASPDYLSRHGTPKVPEELKQHQCLCYSTNSLTPEWRLQKPDGSPWPVQIAGHLHANNGDVLRVAAIEGAGIAYLPSFIVGADLQAATLVSLMPDFVPQDAAIYAVYPNSRHLSPKVRAFIDFMLELFGPRPRWDLQS
ncbi:LysR family transcriptional regulator [Dongia sp.]|uniref:LysR family transcriptional regulator n=1 Tax=Dongia sp. TaxID=1977262 RepID=UPI0035B25B52